MAKMIEKLEKGDKVQPKILGMENERDRFYRLIKHFDNVKKIDNERIKIY